MYNEQLIRTDITVVNDDELSHHGIQGMKWGVRRYQPYDGSTKKGIFKGRKNKPPTVTKGKKGKSASKDDKTAKGSSSKKGKISFDSKSKGHTGQTYAEEMVTSLSSLAITSVAAAALRSKGYTQAGDVLASVGKVTTSMAISGNTQKRLSIGDKPNAMSKAKDSKPEAGSKAPKDLSKKRQAAKTEREAKQTLVKRDAQREVQYEAQEKAGYKLQDWENSQKGQPSAAATQKQFNKILASENAKVSKKLGIDNYDKLKPDAFAKQMAAKNPKKWAEVKAEGEQLNRVDQATKDDWAREEAKD